MNRYKTIMLSKHLVWFYCRRTIFELIFCNFFRILVIELYNMSRTGNLWCLEPIYAVTELSRCVICIVMIFILPLRSLLNIQNIHKILSWGLQFPERRINTYTQKKTRKWVPRQVNKRSTNKLLRNRVFVTGHIHKELSNHFRRSFL